MTAEEALFRAHMEAASYRSGQNRDRWGHPVETPMAWPQCVLWIQSDSRLTTEGSDRVFLRFDVTGYPASAPTAVPWDIENNRPLPGDKWPKGPGNVSKVFNPGWNSGALYCPCDRVAMVGHETWKDVHPQWWWTADSHLSLYLEFLHRCLNPRDHEQ